MFGVEGEKVYQKVVRQMAKKGLRVEELAEKSDLSTNTIYRLNARKMILPVTIHKLAKALDLDSDIFFDN